MKTRMKRITAGILLVLIPMILAGCAPYVSSYRAVAFIHSNEADSAFMCFSSFEGRMVFNLYCGKTERQLSWSASLEEGSAAVFYDCGGEKTGLFSVSSGDDIPDTSGPMVTGTVYVIVETDGPCQNGEFDFKLQ